MCPAAGGLLARRPARVAASPRWAAATRATRTGTWSATCAKEAASSRTAGSSAERPPAL